MYQVESEIRVDHCEFLRESSSDWEDGIIVNEGMGPIVDVNGEIVKDVWNYRVTHRHVMTVPVRKMP